MGLQVLSRSHPKPIKAPLNLSLNYVSLGSRSGRTLIKLNDPPLQSIEQHSSRNKREKRFLQREAEVCIVWSCRQPAHGYGLHINFTIGEWQLGQRTD